MSMKKRVLIAYDGSECANAAIEDLKKAGLPPETEVLVVTVADVFLPAGGYVEESVPESIAVAVKRSWDHASQMVKEAQKAADKAAQKIKSDFPNWQVRAEAFADSPS